MSDLSHLRLENTASALPYTSPQSGGAVEFALPPRDRTAHARKLQAGIQGATIQVDDARKVAAPPPEIDGYPLALRSDPGFELKMESLDRRLDGMELLSVRKDGETTVASIYVRRDKLVKFLKLISDYQAKDSVRTDKHGVQHSKPKNQALIASIASISLTVVRDLWVEPDTVEFPSPDKSIWWEVWLRTTTGHPAEILFSHFSEQAQAAGLTVNQRTVQFPERMVGLVWGTARQLGHSIDVLAYIAELRRAKELAAPYVDLSPRNQRGFVDDAARRVTPSAPDSPAVCLLDTGVNRSHALIAPALDAVDAQAVDPAWGSADHDPNQHGTGMAGIALYQCLTELFTSNGPWQLRHKLESVKLLPPPPGINAPDVYGWVTQEAVSKAEIQAPRRNRAICMAVTADDLDQGQPSSWSAAVDQMCAGELDQNAKLMFISSGNCHVVGGNGYAYPAANMQLHGIQDPAQAWNAITVGAFTEKVFIQDPTFAGWQPVASSGDLAPASRTSSPWPPDNQKEWPYKPDIVLEGGNYITDGRAIDTCPDLEILTTCVRPTGAQLSLMRDTSAATAAAARMAAILWSHYPSLRPETIRALLIHSAQWTPAMLARCPGNSRIDVHRRLRCFGYGVPQLQRAIYSAQNAATLIYEGELQPYHKVKNDYKTKEMHLHDVPWPVEVLEQLGDIPVTMRVTLSYYIEPSPGRRGWGEKHRFQSHGLRFDVISPLEDLGQFKRRVSRAMWEEDQRPDNVQETRNWVVGSRARTRGSAHSDWWTGTAVELARCNKLAVFPVTGWWKERPHLGRINNKARYSLVISLETPAVDVDLYTPIVNMATVSTELVV